MKRYTLAFLMLSGCLLAGAQASHRWDGHKTANPREIKGQTGQFEYPDAFEKNLQKHTLDFAMGKTDAPAAPAPRPDLAGLRVKLPTSPNVYLVNPEGFKQWIPDPYTYNRLFRSWDGIVVDINVTEIPDGQPLSHGATLIRADGTAPVYLISNGSKRYVTSPAVMDKYNFRWPSGGDVVAPAVVDAIPSGTPWN